MIKKVIAIIVIVTTIGATLILNGYASLQFSAQTKYTPTPLPKLKKIDIALVLGGGGAKGLAHVGVIEELEKAGIKPDVIIGCSAGSLIGALYADQLDIKSLKKQLLELNKSELLQYSIRGFPFSLFSNYTFKKYLTKKLKTINFKNLKIPFIAVATELETGLIAPLSKGKIIPAIMASSAVPGAFFPIKINDHYFIDGGASSPVPVLIAKQLGAKIIIAVNIGENLTMRKPNQFFGLAMRSLEISYINHSKLSAQSADVVINMPFRNIGTFNDSLNYYLYNTGVIEAKKKIPLILKKIKAKLYNKELG